MTTFLTKLFLKGKDPEDPGCRGRVGMLSGLVGIVCNLLLATGKLITGAIVSSVSITADALNNFSDAVSSIVTLVGFRMAELPPDEHHPYGHARFEYLSGLGVAAVIVVIGFELGKTSVIRIFHPEPVEFSPVIALVLLASIGVKLWLASFSGKLGRLIDSTTLEAAAADSRNDCISTGAVLIAALVEAITSWKIDGFMGLAVAVFILHSGVDLAKQTISPLLGEATSPELQKKIVDCVASCPKVLGYHDLMVHDYGPGRRFASIHVEMDHREDALACHELIDDMERECHEKNGVHLVIHYDPIVTDDPELDRLRQVVLSILRVRDSRLKIHDFRMVPGDGHTNLIFDLVLPTDLWGQEESIKQSLETALGAIDGHTYNTVITYDSASFS